MARKFASALTRRRLLRTTAAAGVAGLAGCSGTRFDSEPAGTDGSPENGTDDPETENATEGDQGDEGDAADETDPDELNTLEVLHGWVSGDGGAAMTALTDGFEEEHPALDTDFRPIGGGGNTNLHTAITNRLHQSDPPSSFAGWPGRSLEQYEGVLGDVSNVWEEEGFADSHVPEAVDACRTENGDFAAVPINSHRLNCLFYNVDVVESAGVDPTALSSPSDLIDAFDRVAANTDATPMAHGMVAPWTTLQLFEVVLLGQEGYDAFRTFVDGEGGGDAVRRALVTTGTMLSEYISDDARSITYTQANQRLMNGDAAFIHQGNWAAGGYRFDDLEYREDWGFVPFPGTEGMYSMHLDAFVYPVDSDGDNPSPEATEEWLRYVGSADAQRAFASNKKGIPTRTDVDPSKFGPFLAETIEDFRTADERPPTITHGLALPLDALTDMKGVLANNFSGPFDVDATAQGLLDAAQR